MQETQENWNSATNASLSEAKCREQEETPTSIIPIATTASLLETQHHSLQACPAPFESI